MHLLGGNLTSSLESYLQSLNILRSSGYNDEAIEVALVLSAIGQIHLKKGSFVEATVTLQQCMRILDSNGKIFFFVRLLDTFVGGMLTDASSQRAGVPDDNDRIRGIRSILVDAELAFMQNKASNMVGQEQDNSNANHADRVVAVDKIADTYKSKGDYSSAIWFYTEALESRRKMADRLTLGQQASESVEIDIGRTICNIARMRCLRGEFQAAGILFDEVDLIYQFTNLRKDHPFYKEYLDQLSMMRNM